MKKLHLFALLAVSIVAALYPCWVMWERLPSFFAIVIATIWFSAFLSFLVLPNPITSFRFWFIAASVCAFSAMIDKNEVSSWIVVWAIAVAALFIARVALAKITWMYDAEAKSDALKKGE